MAPAISVRSEPAENERKKNFYREGRIPKKLFLVLFWTIMNYSFKLQAFLMKKMVFGTNGLKCQYVEYHIHRCKNWFSRFSGFCYDSASNSPTVAIHAMVGATFS
jgi:hypothetical protein